MNGNDESGIPKWMWAVIGVGGSVPIILMLVVLLSPSDTRTPTQQTAPRESQPFEEPTLDIEVSTELERGSLSLPKHEVLDEEVRDTPVKTQVAQQILVSGSLTEASVRALLRRQFDTIMNRRGFQYHDAPTNVYVYVYGTNEQAQAQQGWLAMLAMGPLDKGEPKLTVRTEDIARMGQKPEDKHDLSESKRKQVFREIIVAERRADNEATAREPSDLDKQGDLYFELRDKHKEEVAKSYSLTRQQLNDIASEGVVKHWVTPPWN